jgi:nucleotide-binding universal stress UspA family protein
VSDEHLRRVLVAVDFSEHSQAAVAWASELVRAAGARLDLLHVCETAIGLPLETALASVGTGPPATLAELARKDAAERLREIAGEARLRGVEPAELRVETGDARRTIVEAAARGGYDLLVLGTHGRTGFGHALLGSVAERVVRTATCPVTTVPRRAAT